MYDFYKSKIKSSLPNKNQLFEIKVIVVKWGFALQQI